MNLTEKEIARFWAKVDRSGGAEACWPWLGGHDCKGYGALTLNGLSIRVHRIAYRLSSGADAGRLNVFHSCDNFSCCNPAHLLASATRKSVGDTLSKKWLARFWKKVDATAGPDACWIWIGARNNKGYGTFGHNPFGTTVASRVAYQIINGPISEEWDVLHRCGNGHLGCVNPLHLYIGTPTDNTLDSVRARTHASSRKTHCPRGHPYSGDNLRVYGRKRYCATCIRARNRAQKLAFA